MSKPQKVTISHRALLQRINRAIASERLQLVKNRNFATAPELGTYYMVDLRRDAIPAVKVDLEKYGRAAKVMKDWEALAPLKGAV